MKNSFLLLLVTLLFAYNQSFAQDITMSTWRMHEGTEGIIPHNNPSHGDPSAYAKMKIPANDAAGWTDAPLDSEGRIKFGGGSASKLNRYKCRQTLDFTYFETVIDVPSNTSISELKVKFGQVDDGARAYIFNSNHPNGTYKGEIKLGQKPVTQDYSSFVKVGERNRIVIVQFDDCATGNNLRNAQVVINGEVLKVTTSPWRMHKGTEGIIAHKNPRNGDPSAYSKMNIPSGNHSGWGPAPLDKKYAILFGGSNASELKGKPCRGVLDFTYFDTYVNIPAGLTVNEFKVSFGQVDDGARAYIFNSKYPNGKYSGEIKLHDSPITADYKDFVAPGENRIVIVQFDDCPVGNNLRDAHIQIKYGTSGQSSTTGKSLNCEVVTLTVVKATATEFEIKVKNTSNHQVNGPAAPTYKLIDLENGECTSCPNLKNGEVTWKIKNKPGSTKLYFTSLNKRCEGRELILD